MNKFAILLSGLNLFSILIEMSVFSLELRSSVSRARAYKSYNLHDFAVYYELLLFLLVYYVVCIIIRLRRRLVAR